MKHQPFLRLGLMTVALGLAVPALADDDCDAPVDRWQSREAVRKMAAQQGWQIQRLKIDDGCYEIQRFGKFSDLGRHTAGVCTRRDLWRRPSPSPRQPRPRDYRQAHRQRGSGHGTGFWRPPVPSLLRLCRGAGKNQRNQGWPALLPLERIHQQSGQQFARWVKR